ncbi:hypothetical protein EK904_004739 [Melospiza melodia maxima]|nr:hypothetical protein EK904_004739 [Melospiza melodia maxima]
MRMLPVSIASVGKFNMASSKENFAIISILMVLHQKLTSHKLQRSFDTVHENFVTSSRSFQLIADLQLRAEGKDYENLVISRGI